MRSLRIAPSAYSTAESWKPPNLRPSINEQTGNWTSAPSLEVSAMPGLRNGSWVALLAIAASSASYANAIGASQVEFRQIYSLVPNGRVTIQNQYGNVSIMGWDRDE